jgi:hypothetical protein
MSRSILAIAALAAAIGVCAQAASTASKPMKSDKPMAAEKTAADKKAAPGADARLIHSAMQAAPAKVAAHATIIEAKADGTMRTVRAGTNGFTCMADNPSTPGPDPMCMDPNAMAFVGALVGHKPPPTGKIGFMYMLSGGTDASNTDPYADKPTANNHWIKTGPHVMLVGADPSFYAMYPHKADPDTSEPYVMWPGSPYQHLMIPVR